MRAIHSLLVCFASLATAAGALADPPVRAKHAGPSRPASTAAGAYLPGKQALVGWHAMSTRSPARDAGGRAMLSLSNINRGESVDVAALGADGGFSASDLDRVAHLLRSATGDEHPIDPRALGLVYRIQTHFDVPEIRVVSGYRVPRAGSRSNHGKGRAVDLIVPGVADEDVARFVREVGFVGVGVYPVSQFVHVDIRPRSYFWIDLSGPHMRNRERCILADLAARSDAAAVARGQSPIEPFVLGTDVDAALRARGGNGREIVVASPPPADEYDDED
jgi:uncharacterized protein YcbK (DUF882 family)